MKKFDQIGALLVSASVLALTAGQAQAQAETASDELVVTGTRVQASGYTAPTPVTVLGAQALEQRAPAAIAEALYELPSIRNTGPTQNNRGSSSVGMNVLNLRNLGDTRTLVLLDGRRFTPANTTTSWDTNLVPTGLVERVEIVTGGASAAYGSDAVAGVVNFILKDRVEGLHGQVHYGTSQESDNIERAANLWGGQSFMNDKLHVVFGADYSKNDGVGKNVGFYARDWGQREYGRLGITQAGLPANIIAENVEFSTKTPGGLIIAGPGANSTAYNTAGQPYFFQRGLVGGDQMLGSLANFGYSSTGRQGLRTPLERYSLFSRATWELSDSVSLFAEFNYGHGEGHGNTAQPFYSATDGGGGIVVAYDNPYLPAATRALLTPGSTITLGRTIEETLPFSTNNENTTRRAVVGARGTIFSDWRWDASYETGKNDYNLYVPNIIDQANFRAAIHAVAGPGGSVVCGPLATNPGSAAQRTLAGQALPGCQPFNPFGLGAPSAASLDYITGYMFNYVNSHQDSFAANLSGSPFSTWAGPVNLAAGYEWRKNEVDGDSDVRSKANLNWYGNYKPIVGEIEVNEGYAEIVVPLASDMAFAKALDLNAAVRRTNYSTSGDVTTWKVGVTYEPTDFLRLRATQSRDIRAPNIGELFQQGGGGVFTGSNPYTRTPGGGGLPGGSGTAPTVTQGNLTLTPEEADTFTAGLVVGPFAGARFAVDYFNIKVEDVIATLGNAELIRRCFQDNNTSACSSFALDASTPLGFTSITSQPLNLNSLETNGIDFEASYRVPMDRLNLPGQIDLRLLATRTMQLETFDASGVSLGNQAGGNTSKWRGTLNVGYELDRFQTNLQLIAFSSIRYNPTFIGPEDPRYGAAIANTTNPNYGLTINKNIFPGYGYVNWSAQYSILDQDKRQLRAFVNIDNVFDRDPPFGWIQDIATYDTIGRTYKIGLRFDY